MESDLQGGDRILVIVIYRVLICDSRFTRKSVEYIHSRANDYADLDANRVQPLNVQCNVNMRTLP